ncbi:uncharacterized protein FOMMEDRAFT_153779 [Fomitiporia mediterranea MF3/22]|uniref:uncharacterized protein n=1 Tax=Fomitiporia mediterranea (strain MF3/22) TaxID=694068 RepID=UPI0004408F42|nr:uncharacterized protein FOMMEDRAFT_153779 [Fomitiporia mediterranea MF3/22]EJD04708.1 hypothetical protein FOMMEDRAFT_153779 [Fomitiporia mediterranea MF3/22]
MAVVSQQTQTEGPKEGPEKSTQQLFLHSAHTMMSSGIALLGAINISHLGSATQRSNSLVLSGALQAHPWFHVLATGVLATNNSTICRSSEETPPPRDEPQEDKQTKSDLADGNRTTRMRSSPKNHFLL